MKINEDYDRTRFLSLVLKEKKVGYEIRKRVE
jgi:hypothetical protein